MDRRAQKIFLLVFMFLLFSTCAFGLGVDDPYNFYGTGAKLFQSSTGGSILGSATLIEEVENTSPDGEAGDSYFENSDSDGDADYETMQNVSQYEFHGYIEAEGYDYNYTAVSYFFDELYIETANGETADITISFDLSYYMETYDENSYAEFLILSAFWDDGTVQDYIGGYNDSLEDTIAFISYDSTFSLSLSNLESEKYYGFSVSVNATAMNALIDWSHSIYFSDIVVSQNGVELTEDQYTISTSSNEMPTAPVPEPSTMLLLGAGLASLVGARRKLKK